jgi:hypothetical protein
MIATLSIHITCTFLYYTKTFVCIQLTKLLLFCRKIEEPLRNRGIAVPFGIYHRFGSENVEQEESDFLNNICTSWLAFI